MELEGTKRGQLGVWKIAYIGPGCVLHCWHAVPLLAMFNVSGAGAAACVLHYALWWKVQHGVSTLMIA